MLARNTILLNLLLGTTMSETIQPNIPQKNPPQSGGVYLALAILSTIFCCLPFGIPAIVFAAQIDGKLRAGDTEGATRAAKQAKTWIIVSAASGAAIALIYVIFVALVGVAALGLGVK